MKIELKEPIKIGDKVWMPKNNKDFETCNFMNRYTKYEETTVTDVKLEYFAKTGKTEWLFTVEGHNCWYIYTGKTCFTKEQLYESFREEIEQLIPQEIRDYLWPNK